MSEAMDVDANKNKKIKGRGHSDKSDERYNEGEFEKVQENSEGVGPKRSIEGWIVFITGVHEEAQEEDIKDKFCEFGEIKNVHLPLDRRSGFVKGYALVEYETKSEASKAIENMNGAEFMGLTLAVDWAFTTGPRKGGNKPRISTGRSR